MLHDTKSIYDTLFYFAILDSIVLLSIIGISYLVFKKGLAFRLFAVVFSITAFTVYCGIILGITGFRWASIVTVVPIGIALASGAIIWLYRTVVQNLTYQTNGLMSNVSQLSAAARQSASVANEQSAAVNEITTTVEEMNQLSAATAQNVKEMLDKNDQAEGRSTDGLQKIVEAIRAIDAIGRAREIVETVEEFAEQSNLLALNASIEAAKAGDSGKGFAVVAAEVRSMAERSKQATQQIRKAISNTEVSEQSIREVNIVLKELAHVLRDNSDRARQISGAAQQQSAGIKQILNAMHHLAEGGRNVAVMSDQIKQSSADLSGISGNLKSFVIG